MMDSLIEKVAKYIEIFCQSQYLPVHFEFNSILIKLFYNFWHGDKQKGV